MVKGACQRVRVQNTYSVTYVGYVQMPHYNLEEATEAIKPIMKDYYRVPEKSKGPIPFHLWGHLSKSFQEDHFVADQGDVVFYEKDPDFGANLKASQKRSSA